VYITQTLHRNTQTSAGLPATICAGRTRTWEQVHDRVARLAGAVRALGVTSAESVAILSLNSDRYSEYLYAVPWADAVVNPVNIRWSAPEVAFSLVDSDTRVLFVDDAFAPMLPALQDAAPGLKVIVHCGDAPTPAGCLAYEELIGDADPIADARRGDDAPAGIFYTGGTTGHPKGVVLSHRNLITSALGSAASTDFMVPGGVYLHAAPMFHLADLAAWNARNLIGGSHVMVPMFTPAGVAAAIEAHRVTDVLLVPTMIQMLLDSPEGAQADLSSLVHLLYGASPISDGLLDRTGQRLPGVRLIQAYGMTEVAPVATVLTPEDHAHPVRRRSGGRAAPHAEVRIVDAEDNEVPRGTVGEVVVRGDHVMLGYWNRPEETAQALRNGWMHTGDGAYMDDDGYVYIVDRIKDMIVTGGENVYSAEVENALSTHPAIAACAVIGVPDDEFGERVHAVVILAADATLSHEELREHCKALIAGYKAPRSSEFVTTLPLSGAGKILKRELRAQYWAERGRGVS
jgi:acyl-CoA synthetase (AMP-forming)/AMP-acid ligase II